MMPVGKFELRSSPSKLFRHVPEDWRRSWPRASMIGCISASAARKTIAVTRSREQTDRWAVRTEFRVEELDGGGVHLGVERQKLGTARDRQPEAGTGRGASAGGEGRGRRTLPERTMS